MTTLTYKPRHAIAAPVDPHEAYSEWFGGRPCCAFWAFELWLESAQRRNQRDMAGVPSLASFCEDIEGEPGHCECARAMGRCVRENNEATHQS
jgi:hypothetical protein